MQPLRTLTIPVLRPEETQATLTKTRFGWKFELSGDLPYTFTLNAADVELLQDKLHIVVLPARENDLVVRWRGSSLCISNGRFDYFIDEGQFWLAIRMLTPATAPLEKARPGAARPSTLSGP